MQIDILQSLQVSTHLYAQKNSPLKDFHKNLETLHSCVKKWNTSFFLQRSRNEQHVFSKSKVVAGIMKIRHYQVKKITV